MKYVKLDQCFALRDEELKRSEFERSRLCREKKIGTVTLLREI